MERSTAGPWAAAGFAAGALAVPLAHQPMLAALRLAGLASAPLYSLAPTAPFGIPKLVSLAFWGGVWGVPLALRFRSWPRGGRLRRAALFGALLPTLAAWFVVAPLKGQPAAGGFKPSAMAVGLLVNGAWGLAAGLLAAGFERP